MPLNDTRSGKVLVVDDDQGKRYIVGRQLRAEGYAVDEAITGAEALRMAGAAPDLIVLDIKLPDMSGLEVCRLLKADPATASILVLALSATFAMGRHKVAGLESGADAYLTHPVAEEELLATVHALMRLRRAEQAQAELLRQAEEARREALRAGEFREQLLGIVGHDLRNPLAAIQLTAARLLRRNTMQEPDRALLQRINQSVQRMNGIIEQILDLTRGRLGGGIQIERRPVVLAQVCQQVLEEMEAAHPDHRFSLRVAGDTAGEWDGGRLAQVVSNLVGNALEHGDPAGPVEVALRDEGPQINLSVSNQGPPIPAELQAGLFEPFRRGKDQGGGTSHGQGLGLGLYIVKEIVTAHGGSIAVRSALGEGTCFSISLPRRSAAAGLAC